MKVHLSRRLRHGHGVARRPAARAGTRGHGLRPGRLPADVDAARGARASPCARPTPRRTCRADADLVVIGNALSRGNPEVEAVLDRRQRYTSLPALWPRSSCATRTLAGRGGNTRQDHDHQPARLPARIAPGCDPSFLIGGVPRRLRPQLPAGRGRALRDRGRRVRLAPSSTSGPSSSTTCRTWRSSATSSSTTPTSIPTSRRCRLAFVRLLHVIPRQRPAGRRASRARRSCAILARGSLPRRDLRPRAGADWRAVDVETRAGGSRFRLLRARAGRRASFALPLAGEHNVRNALAALAVAAEAGVAAGGGAGGARRLPGRQAAPGACAARRGGVTVYDDFAHHPTAVRETLEALRALGGGGRLVAVFEPRSYTSRTRVFQDDFARAFAGADRVDRRGRPPAGQGPGGLAAVGGRPRRGDRRARAAEPSSCPAWTTIVRPWRRSCGRATAWRSSRTAASAASTRSCSARSEGTRGAASVLKCGRSPLGSVLRIACISAGIHRTHFPRVGRRGRCRHRPRAGGTNQLPEEETMKRELLALVGLALLLARPRSLRQEPSPPTSRRDGARRSPPPAGRSAR